MHFEPMGKDLSRCGSLAFCVGTSALFFDRTLTHKHAEVIQDMRFKGQLESGGRKFKLN